MLRLSAGIDSKVLNGRLAKLSIAVQDGSFDQPIEIAAFKIQRELVLLTPKKWTGMLRRSWQISKPTTGTRLIYNTSKIMRFIEEGTGLMSGGYIYPKTKKSLFIPLTSSAAIGGWNKSLVYGQDYILAKRVRGIGAKYIIKNFRPRGNQILRTEMGNFLKKALT